MTQIKLIERLKSFLLFYLKKNFLNHYLLHVLNLFIIFNKYVNERINLYD